MQRLPNGLPNWEKAIGINFESQQIFWTELPNKSEIVTRESKSSIASSTARSYGRRPSPRASYRTQKMTTVGGKSVHRVPTHLYLPSEIIECFFLFILLSPQLTRKTGNFVRPAPPAVVSHNQSPVAAEPGKRKIAALQTVDKSAKQQKLDNYFPPPTDTAQLGSPTSTKCCSLLF